MSIKEYVNTSSFFVVGAAAAMAGAIFFRTHKEQKFAEENKPGMITVMHRGLDSVIVDTLEQDERIRLTWAEKIPGIYNTANDYGISNANMLVVTYKTNHGVQRVFPAENQYLVQTQPTSAR